MALERGTEVEVLSKVAAGAEDTPGAWLLPVIDLDAMTEVRTPFLSLLEFATGPSAEAP